MTNRFIFLFGALSLTAASPAFAGPDWAAIEQGRKLHRNAQIEHSDVYEAAAPTAAGP